MTRNKSLIVFWILSLVISLMFLVIYVKDFPWSDPRFGLEIMIKGTAHKPFVYRVLMPSLIRIASIFHPPTPKIYASVLMYLFLVGFVFSFRFLADAFLHYKQNSMMISLASFSALVLLRLPYPYAHLYDFATLCLFTLGLALMVRHKWLAFLLIYLLGCLNKETTLLLTVAFTAYFYRRIPNRAFLTLLLAQIVIFVVIRIWITWQYRGNPGSTLEFNLSRHLAAMTLLPVFTVVYSFMGSLGLWAILRKWGPKPIFLKQTLLSTLPILVVLYFLFGSPFEFRVFYEVLPVAFLLVMPVLPPNKRCSRPGCARTPRAPRGEEMG